jgi:hypothetical protein
MGHYFVRTFQMFFYQWPEVLNGVVDDSVKSINLKSSIATFKAFFNSFHELAFLVGIGANDQDAADIFALFNERYVFIHQFSGFFTVGWAVIKHGRSVLLILIYYSENRSKIKLCRIIKATSAQPFANRVFSLLAQLVSGGFLDLRFGGKKLRRNFVVVGLKRCGGGDPRRSGVRPAGSPLFAGIIEAGLILDPAHAAGGPMVGAELLFGLSPSPLFAGIIEAGLILDPAHAAGGPMGGGGDPRRSGVRPAGSPLFAGIIEAGLILDPAHAAGGVLFACGSPLFAGIIEAGLHLDPSLCSG